ncbi:MAG: YjfB family protein [Armatimonadota bacterium]|nr:YjfB family protein [Armatimonadota bacterium]
MNRCWECVPSAQSPAVQQAQVSVARKVLDVQKQAAATLLKQLEGVGQRIDVRV